MSLANPGRLSTPRSWVSALCASTPAYCDPGVGLYTRFSFSRREQYRLIVLQFGTKTGHFSSMPGMDERPGSFLIGRYTISY